MAMTASFLAQIEKGITTTGAPNLFAVLAMTLPDGTTLRASSRAVPRSVADAAGGPVWPIVQQWGALPLYAIDLEANSLAFPETTVDLLDEKDPHYELKARPPSFGTYRAVYRRALKYAPVTITVYSPDCDDVAADAWLAFSGVYIGASQSDWGAWQIRIAVDSNPLRYQQIPREKITSDLFPDAHPDVLDKPIPLVYGQHSAQFLTGTGMLPTLNVDTAAYKYMVSLGHIQAVPRVYKDGVSQTLTTHYTIEKYDTNGLWWTGVKMVSDPGDAAITVDASGFTDDATGAGALITNHVAQARHLLSQFVYSRWRRGAWAAEASIIDATLSDAAEVEIDAIGDPGARYLGTEQSADTWLEELCKTFEGKPFWTPEGKIGFGLLSPPSDAGYTETWIRGDQESFSVIGDEDGVFDPLRQIILRYQHGAVSGDFFASLRIVDPRITDRSEDSRDLKWSDSSS